MKILHYCQHVLGIGHFFRSLEILKALKEHEVLLVSGGPGIDVPLPQHVRKFQLPGLMMDRNFTALSSIDVGKPIDAVKSERRDLLLSLFQKEKPDLFLVELYPFGRKAFRFELDPLLNAIRRREVPACDVICSLRDILVEKQDTVAYEQRVIDTLNTLFDALLVHADPRLVKLEETFTRVPDISIPIAYTGFVTPKPGPNDRGRLRKRLGIGPHDMLIVASAGGGKVGARLLESLLSAARLLDNAHSLHIHTFTGPFMDGHAFNRLRKLSKPKMPIFRFTPEFISYLAAADLSVSMAGYNTCMNIMASGVPALIWPFPQNREQRLRAERLSHFGSFHILEEQDLEPHQLASVIKLMPRRSVRTSPDVNLDGAAGTAGWIESWASAREGRAQRVGSKEERAMSKGYKG
jgi:predicted glycosyltransferase